MACVCGLHQLEQGTPQRLPPDTENFDIPKISEQNVQMLDQKNNEGLSMIWSSRAMTDLSMLDICRGFSTYWENIECNLTKEVRIRRLIRIILGAHNE